MKQCALVLSLLLLAAACSPVYASPASSAASRGEFPSSFASIDDARKWANEQFAGGRTDEVRAHGRDHLVIFLHGAGVPVVRVGLYRRQRSHWEFRSAFAPPSKDEFLNARSEEGNIIMVGERSGQRWPVPSALGGKPKG